MKRATVKLSDELHARLHVEAKRRGLTISELGQEAIEAHLANRGPRRLLAAAAASSGQSDISERVEQICREEWGRQGPQ